jgi:hypothetical protein
LVSVCTDWVLWIFCVGLTLETDLASHTLNKIIRADWGVAEEGVSLRQEQALRCEDPDGGAGAAEAEALLLFFLSLIGTCLLIAFGFVSIINMNNWW